MLAELHSTSMCLSLLRNKLTLWALLALSWCLAAEAGCTNLLTQGFEPYGKAEQYSKSLVQQDFPSTKGPFKMIEGGDQGSPTCTVGDNIIRGSFPQGTEMLVENPSVVNVIFNTSTRASMKLFCREDKRKGDRLHVVFHATERRRGNVNVIQGQILSWI
jgi:hypothetical protein